MDNNLLASFARFGAEQAVRDALANDDNPPKLQAAALMATAAEDRAVTMADLPEITKAYFQGNLPKSAPQQQAKFGAFLKAGMAGYGSQTIERVREIIRGTNDPKAQAKAKSGIFEKMVGAMRKALEANGVPSEEVLREVLFGADKTAEDVELKALGQARKALEMANNVSGANMAKELAALDLLIARREAEIAHGGRVVAARSGACSRRRQAYPGRSRGGQCGGPRRPPPECLSRLAGRGSIPRPVAASTYHPRA